MVSVAAKAKQKQITWTEEGRRAFSTLKSLVNKCPKLYFIDTKLPIILYTDASDYAHGAYLCQVKQQEDGTTVELPIRFLSGTFSGAQIRWSTIEKEAFAIYWALKKLDDLVGGVRFTIRTDHRNLHYLNNHGSRKVLQWKLDIQHYDAIIEHVPGELNVPADVFSRLVSKAPVPVLNQIVILQCTDAQRILIKECHEWLHAHYGVDRTILHLTQRHPKETSADKWPHFRHDVRAYIQSCVTCQKMSNNSGSPFCCFNATANAKNRHGHHWSAPRSDDLQVYYRVHRHIYQICRIVPRKHGVCNLSWKCAMETHMPVLYTVRNLNRSGYTVYEPNTNSPRLNIWH